MKNMTSCIAREADWRLKLRALLAGCLIVAAMIPSAQARPNGNERQREPERQQREHRREAEPPRHQGEQGRSGRMTPEERQQLRQDIREYGRDVYRDGPKRR